MKIGINRIIQDFYFILGILGTLKEQDYNSNISSNLSHVEFIDFLDYVVEHLNKK